MITLQEMLDQSVQLPLEQQKILANVLQHRCIELEREVIAQEAARSLSEFRQGAYVAQTAEEIISELNCLIIRHE